MDGSIEGQDDMLDDGEPQTRSAHDPVSGLVHPVEPLVYPVYMLFRNSNPRILNDDPDLPLKLVQDDLHLSAILGVFDGIIDEVDDHLLVVVLIPVGMKASTGNEREVDVLRFRLWREHMIDLIRFADDIQKLDFGRPGLLDGRQGQNIVDQPREPFTFLIDDIKKLDSGFFILHILQGL